MADTSIFETFKSDIQKTFKKQKKNILIDQDNVKEPIPTGSLIIDSTFGGGLFYRGSIGEIVSMESGAKTTLSIQTCANALKKYPNEAIIYVDAEKALDTAYAKSLGMDINDPRVIVVTPDSTEDFELFLAETFGNKSKIRDKISTMIVDSVAALRPISDVSFEKKDQTAQKSGHAFAWGSVLLPKMMNVAATYNVAIVLINQFRAKINIDRNAQFSLANTGIGNATSGVNANLSTTGGSAMRYYLSTRYVTKFVTTLKEQVEDPITGAIEEIRVANIFKIQNIKNKILPPYKETKFVVRYGEGVDDFPLVYEALNKRGIIYNKGSFLYYKTTDGREIKELGKFKFQAILKDQYWNDMQLKFKELLIDDSNLLEETPVSEEDIEL
jgi:recombination protein RecA